MRPTTPVGDGASPADTGGHGRRGAPVAPAEARPLRLILIEDHPGMRSGISAILESDDIEVVAEGASALAGVAAVRDTDCDLILLDVGLPDERGAAAVQRLVDAAGDTPVLVYSAEASSELVRACLQAGAVGFILKTSASADLQVAVRRAAAGHRVIDAELTPALLGRGSAELTERELEVLAVVSEGLTNRQVAARLGLAEDTVKTHLSRSMTKLGAADRTHAIAILLRSGILR